MPEKTWFLMFNQDYPPGSIQLGQIVSPYKPPWNTVADPFKPLPEIRDSSKVNYFHHVNEKRTMSPGMFLKFLSTFGPGGELKGTYGTQFSLATEVRELKTQFIEPTDEYVTQSVRREAVQERIKEFPTRSIFMVTGLKIASGAKVWSNNGDHVGGGVGVDLGAILQSGVSVGPKLEMTRSRMEDVGFENSSDYIYAYCLRKIIITWKGQIRNSPYLKGATALNHEEELFEDGSNTTEDMLEGKKEEPQLNEIYLGEGDYSVPGKVPSEFEALQMNDGDDGCPCQLFIPKMN